MDGDFNAPAKPAPKQRQNQNQNPEKQCPKCGTYFQTKDALCQRCRHVENYVSYLSSSGSLI